MRNPKYDPPGIEFLDKASGRYMRLIDDTVPNIGGWLVYWHEHGQNWVTLRKSTDADRDAVKRAELAGECAHW